MGVNIEERVTENIGNKNCNSRREGVNIRRQPSPAPSPPPPSPLPPPPPSPLPPPPPLSPDEVWGPFVVVIKETFESTRNAPGLHRHRARRAVFGFRPQKIY